MTSLTLTLNTPEAKAAIGRCYSLLRTWAREAREQETTGQDEFGDQTRPVASDADRSQHPTDSSSTSVLEQENTVPCSAREECDHGSTD